MRVFREIFAPLALATSDKVHMSRLLEELGWRVTFSDEQVVFFKTALGVTDDVTELAGLVQEVASSSSPDGNKVGRIIELGESIFTRLQTLANVDANLLLQLPEPFNTPSSWGDLALRLPDYLITTWMRLEYEPLFETLRFVGLIRVEELPAPEGGEARDIDRINWTSFPQFLTDPVGLIQSTYGWGGEFDHAMLIGNLAALTTAYGFTPDLRPVRQDIRDRWGTVSNPGAPLEINMPLVKWQSANRLARFDFDLVLAPAAQGNALTGIQLTNFTSGSIDASLDLGDDWTFEIDAEGDLDQLLSLSATPSGIDLDVNASGAGASAEFTLLGEPEDLPWILIGSETGPRLELSRLKLNLGTHISTQTQELFVGATTLGGDPGLKLVISPGDGDGFIADILGDQEMAITADIGAHWSSETGFKFEGGVGFDVTIPIDKKIGPILLSNLRLGLSGGSHGVTAELAVSGGLDIAVLAVAVEDIGIRAEAVPVPEGQRGLLGPMDLKLGFKPPKGLGLVIDAAGIVSGGGYLYHDEALAEYGGVAELGFIAVKLSAIGILTTRMPDGSDGWSLFLSVFSEFPPVQLAFGITLNGVGGLVGLHRTFDDEALRTRLLDGALDSIMFPEDPVANAPRILEDIRAVFPPCQGQFVFGAMLKLGWGTPSVLTLDLGVIVELPDPIKIALLGQLNLSLPKPEKTIIELNMDVFGVVNITEGTIAVDATIRDSHILEILTLSGDMAFRASFGDQPTMLMSVGGFHPKFTPPPGIPDLRRMRASLPVGNVGSVDLLAYIAITSNSFQAGGRIEIWVRAAGFSAEGYFGFDALIQFSPFGFDFFVEFGVTVSAGKITLMGVDVSASVVGPGPWVIDGHATFKILKVKKTLNVEFEVGQRKTVAVPSYDVEAELVRELENPENWRVAEDTGGVAHIILREPTEDEAARALPSGVVAFSQKTVPLHLKLEKFGAGTIDGRKEFQISSTRIGNGQNTYDASRDLTEWFAPAEFLKMKDNEKLKAPAYELFDSGVEIGGTGVSFGTQAERDVDYEEIIIDPALNTRIAPLKKRPLADNKELLSQMKPGLRDVAFKGPELKLKVAPTKFADARLITKRKVA